MKLPCCVALALVTFLPLARGQQAAPSPGPSPSLPPLPAGPLLKRAPDPSQWVVTSTPIKPAGASATAAPSPNAKPKAPTRMVVTKTGQYRHAVTRDGDGKQSEVWCQGNIEVFLRPEWKQPVLTDGSNQFDALFVDFSRTDFPGCEWINARNYAGIQKYAGRDCIVFQTRLNMGDAPAPAKPPGAAGPGSTSSAATENTLVSAAYVDLETRLPLASRRGDVVTTYQFDKPPDEPLSLPPDVREVIDARARRQMELGRKPSGSR